jgi:carboxymethylenebutenolidase
VAWYGPPARAQKDDPQPVSALDVAAEVPCPVLLLYGGADQSIPVADVEKEAATLKAAGRPVETHIYPGVGHAFFADYRASYREGPAFELWAEVLAFLEQHLR